MPCIRRKEYVGKVKKRLKWLAKTLIITILAVVAICVVSIKFLNHKINENTTPDAVVEVRKSNFKLEAGSKLTQEPSYYFYVAGDDTILDEAEIDFESVDTNTPGEYEMPSLVGGEEYTLHIQIVDTTPPEIELSSTAYEVKVGEPLSTNDLVSGIKDVSPLASYEVDQDVIDTNGKLDKEANTFPEYIVRFTTAGIKTIVITAIDIYENETQEEVTIIVTDD